MPVIHTGVSPDADRGKLTVSLALIVGFMPLEVVVGAVVHSLALLSDAAHMLTDAGAIRQSLVAIRLAAKPATGVRTPGPKRHEILSAQFTGATRGSPFAQRSDSSTAAPMRTIAFAAPVGAARATALARGRRKMRWERGSRSSAFPRGRESLAVGRGVRRCWRSIGCGA